MVSKWIYLPLKLHVSRFVKSQQLSKPVDTTKAEPVFGCTRNPAMVLIRSSLLFCTLLSPHCTYSATHSARETFAPKPTKPSRGRPFPAKKPSLCATATIPSMLSSELPELCKVASKARTKLAEDTVSPIRTTWAKRSPQNKVQWWVTKLATDWRLWMGLGNFGTSLSNRINSVLALFISLFPSCVFETVCGLQNPWWLQIQIHNAAPCFEFLLHGLQSCRNCFLNSIKKAACHCGNGEISAQEKSMLHALGSQPLDQPGKTLKGTR